MCAKRTATSELALDCVLIDSPADPGIDCFYRFR
ncbi:hypothetical protein KPSA1_02780 [Pseudomonas syringae pv. actinidiae]|uniref:Uncharacterized protein n=1 Tax=Pseudomonas syringae pv. actinidiae TaxID=103796 RepID=A0A2V0QGE5_PSESF|nr:hypothetical protein KPSA1_02780 [Pseudomonas syringae pv. actinidiae]